MLALVSRRKKRVCTPLSLVMRYDKTAMLLAVIGICSSCRTYIRQSVVSKFVMISSFRRVPSSASGNPAVVAAT